MLKKVKQRLINWLLKDVEIQELVVKKLKVGSSTVKVHTDGIDFPGLTSDPSLVAGRLWYRRDLDQWRYSPDGSVVKTIGGGGLQKVAEGSANNVSSVSITGLDGDSDKHYLLIAYIENPSADLAAYFGMTFNNDTTSGNYAGRIRTFTNTDISGDDLDDKIGIGYVREGSESSFIAFIRAISGYKRCVVALGCEGKYYAFIGSGHWKNTTDNVTSIEIRFFEGTATRSCNVTYILYKIVS